jgi:chromosome segregation ATPase
MTAGRARLPRRWGGRGEHHLQPKGVQFPARAARMSVSYQESLKDAARLREQLGAVTRERDALARKLAEGREQAARMDTARSVAICQRDLLRDALEALCDAHGEALDQARALLAELRRHPQQDAYAGVAGKEPG